MQMLEGIEIIGVYLVPEFGTIAAILAVVIISIIAICKIKTPGHTKKIRQMIN